MIHRVFTDILQEQVTERHQSQFQHGTRFLHNMEINNHQPDDEEEEEQPTGSWIKKR